MPSSKDKGSFFAGLALGAAAGAVGCLLSSSESTSEAVVNLQKEWQQAEAKLFQKLKKVKPRIETKGKFSVEKLGRMLIEHFEASQAKSNEKKLPPYKTKRKYQKKKIKKFKGV